MIRTKLRAAALLSVLLSPMAAAALPGLYVGKQNDKLVAHTTHVVVLKSGQTSVVSYTPDYEGPLVPFAWVVPVPGDVTLERIKTLKMEYVDRLEKLTAPRFHEFWEMDPCEPGPPEQEWERSLVASASTDFLGGPAPDPNAPKVAKELFVKVEPDYKDGEYSMTLLAADQAKTAPEWLKAKGYALAPEAEKSLQSYISAGMNVLIAEVDTKRIELIGGNLAQLSPVRFWTEQPFKTIPSRLGLANSPGKQELLVYVLDPDKRYEAKNYPNVFAPTNIKVDFIVKEKMGEFYTALHDLMLEKNPQAFINEFAWPSNGCGQPCQNEPLLPHELLSLGGDVVEQNVPEQDKHPEPPKMSEDEEKALKAKLEEMKPADRLKAQKDHELERKEILRRKALIERQKYMVSRVHHRYDEQSLPKDPEIGPAAGHVEGGARLPKGEAAEIANDVKPGQESKHQTRYLFFHPWKGMMKCEKPERFRWGKPPRTYRGLRKIWVAEDLAEKDRKRIQPANVVMTPIPALGLSGQIPDADAGADAGASEGEAEKKKGGCGCELPGAQPGSGWPFAALTAVFGVWLVRRRR
jgi:MYXO-CTERM domain-containing protein